MAGFHTHITVSTAVGVGYAFWGGAQYGLPFSTCALAGGLCAIAGMLPDLDSDGGVPARETLGLASAIVPMLLFQRFQQQGMSVEHMVLAGAPIYLFIRFGIGSLLKSMSVHRGMFHSIPAAIIAGLIGYLICDSGVTLVRYYKAFSVTLGYMTHLILDEMWSVNLTSGMPRVKKSFGTALKLFSDDAGATMTTYCALGLLVAFILNDANAGRGLAATTPQAGNRIPLASPLQPTEEPRQAVPREAERVPTRPSINSTIRNASRVGAQSTSGISSRTETVDPLSYERPRFVDPRYRETRDVESAGDRRAQSNAVLPSRSPSYDEGEYRSRTSPHRVPSLYESETDSGPYRSRSSNFSSRLPEEGRHVAGDMHVREPVRTKSLYESRNAEPESASVWSRNERGHSNDRNAGSDSRRSYIEAEPLDRGVRDSGVNWGSQPATRATVPAAKTSPSAAVQGKSPQKMIEKSGRSRNRDVKRTWLDEEED